MDIVFAAIDRTEKLDHDRRLKERVVKAIIGKFLAEESKNLPPDADSWAYYKARDRANNRADYFAEIVVSANNAEILLQELTNFVPQLTQIIKKVFAE
jgi:hypothetical protein